MIVVNFESDMDTAIFAEAAAIYMAKNPTCYTYAVGDPEPGKLLAIRWNCFTILVVRLDEDRIPELFPVHQFIQADLPPLKPCFYQ